MCFFLFKNICKTIVFILSLSKKMKKQELVLSDLKKNIFYNIHDSSKKPIKILRIDISGELPIAEFFETQKGSFKISSIYLHYLAKI